jgi:hypothetical protein
MGECEGDDRVCWSSSSSSPPGSAHGGCVFVCCKEYLYLSSSSCFCCDVSTTCSAANEIRVNGCAQNVSNWFNGKCSQHISAVQWEYESATYIEAKNVL